MRNIPIDAIDVPPNRLREDMKTVPLAALAESMQTFGQLVPIVVSPLPNERFLLIAGERRLRAAQSLGWEHITAITRADATEDERRCLEIIENLHREQFTWPEEIRAKKELHDRMERLHSAPSAEGIRLKGQWTLEHTAQLMGQSKATLSRDLALYEHMEAMPTLTEKPTKSAAHDYARRHTDFAIRKVIAQDIVTQQRTERAEAMQPGRYVVLEGDCIQMMQTHVPDASVDLICTDPPFGIRMKEDGVGSWASWQGLLYNDTEDEYVVLMRNFLREAFRVLKEGRHCYVFCGWEWVDWLRAAAEAAGFICPGAPGIWVKLGGVWRQHMDRLQTNYYNILFMAKPYAEAKTHRWQQMDGYVDAAVSHIARVSGRKRHPAEAPVELFELYIKASSVRNETVLDPFCGSGSSGVAALMTHRQYIGIDVDANWATLTKLRCEEVQTVSQQPLRATINMQRTGEDDAPES